jgi:hypothetical protein
MVKHTSFMNWLEKHYPALFEIFSKDGIFVEKVNKQFFLHVTIIEEEVSLDELNKLQNAWKDFILFDNLGEEAHPLLITQNKF